CNLVDLYSFPTRRSSDLVALEVGDSVMLSVSGVSANGEPVSVSGVTFTSLDTQIATVDQRGMVYGVAAGMARIEVKAGALRDTRSEEHTSELQSRENLVC